MDKKIEKNELIYIFIYRLFDILSLLFKYVFYSFASFMIYLSIKELAGKETVANFLFKLITSKESCSILPWVISLVTATWACMERFFRRKNIKRLAERNKKLELKLSPNRTSSNLTATGKTNPEDKL